MELWVKRALICQHTTLAHNGFFPVPDTLRRFGQKAENLSSKLPSSLLAIAAFPLAMLPDPELWGSHHGSAAIMVQELEVGSGEHKMEEWRLSKGLPGMNVLLCQSKGLDLSHLSYSSLALPIAVPTKHGCKTRTVGWMNHYSCFREKFYCVVCGIWKKKNIGEKWHLDHCIKHIYST